MRPAAQLVELGARDIQASADSREVRIDEVGVEGVSYPVAVVGVGRSHADTPSRTAEWSSTSITRFEELT